ncbi:ribosome hibernation-promoting factor, HPF/YfiA family [Amycolatopsis taiwanensis]|uniref:Ribosome hibernation promoting factor n=1 Tax=Amycolatopsis taiwanensis TaxID=342230 RepID=A0A9W6QUN4_9PSEU|nr:ribosome-associated translation inhibitor RaiA [Amycolatopsis taiwanensis]GLY64489.1 ribosomal subunit interface protein [Amycolatopsis taiwanensis]
MDIVVKGRNVEVPDHYRTHVSGKLARLERYDKKVFRYDVELFHEPNRRQAKSCQRVEITVKGRGPVVRAEASAGDFYAALDAAVSKLENRLRRIHDRRRVHYGRSRPESVAEATSAVGAGATTGSGPLAGTSTAVLEAPAAEQSGDAIPSSEVEVPQPRWDTDAIDHTPGRIVREKHHSAEPMTVDRALHNMELVGHDFYLFNDAETGRPSVVYRRKGFDYGVIRLG